MEDIFPNTNPLCLIFIYFFVFFKDISPNAEFFSAGYQGGQITVWDLTTGHHIKTMSDPNRRNPIVHVRFFHPTKCHLLVLDNHGNATMLKYGKVLGLWRAEVTCVLDGEATGVIYECAVLMPADGVPHASDQSGLVAFATPKLVFVICCYPKVIFLQNMYIQIRDQILGSRNLV
jgi:hypothetical protein